VQVKTFQFRMDGYQRMLITIQEMNVPRLQQLIRVGLKQGQSISKITEQMNK
jgi:mRNA degradation ribonuclease J1/J2